MAKKGERIPIEVRLKIGKANKGKKRTEQQKERLRIFHTGTHHTEETKQKLKERMKGKKRSQETRIKQSIAAIKRGNPVGKLSHNWRGGITPVIKRIRNSFEYRQWRSDVFQRDSYTCVWCGDKHGGNLNADHIKEFNVILKEHKITTLEEAEKCEELWNINNGRTLCESCHIKRHKKNN